MRPRHVLLVHAAFFVVGLGLLFVFALPVSVWDGVDPTGSGALWWTVPAALVVGAVGGGLEGLLLRVFPPLGWTVAVVACFFGFLVPATFVGHWPGEHLPGTSSAVAAAWFGWLLFVVVLTGGSLGVLAIWMPKRHRATSTPAGGPGPE